jgi:hypothetical protein
MINLCAQGDILIERVVDLPLSGIIVRCEEDRPLVIAEGEATGHRHSLLGPVTMYRDDTLAQDIPAGLYVAHVQVASAAASLEHEEHAPITLPQGTYRIRQQRQLALTDIGTGDDFRLMGD